MSELELRTAEEKAGYCPRCKDYRVFGPSTCRCVRFECGEPWNGKVEDWHEIYATDAEHAAEKCAEQFDDEGDHTIINNGSGEIWTRDTNGLVQKWEIEAEAVPSYNARERK